jgi:YVTN family beta-propeller protein
MAITEDGEYAYLAFALSEVVFKIRLEDLSVEAVAELYEHFPIQSPSLALGPNEEKLFVLSLTWPKLLVLDAQTMDLIQVVDNVGNLGMLQSRHGSQIITWDGGINVWFIDTETYEVTQFRDGQMKFVKIKESPRDPDKWYVVSGNPQQGHQVGVYDYKAKVWDYSVPLPVQKEDEGISDLEVLLNEQKAYVATLGGWYPESRDPHGYGWLYSVDLASGRSPDVLPIDGGALSLDSSSDSRRLYIGTGWPLPTDKPLLILDTQSDTVVGQVSLPKTADGWPHTEIDDVRVDPTNPRYLYAAVTDSNDFVKVDLERLTIADQLILNQQVLRPHAFVRMPGESTGYIFVHESAKAFRFDIEQAAIENVVELPLTRSDVFAYTGAINAKGRLLLPQGETVLEVDAESLELLDAHPLPAGFPGLWHISLSRDERHLYAIAYARDSEQPQPSTFVAINAESFQVEAVTELSGGAFRNRLFELPDGSKLYAVGGTWRGQVVVHIIETDNHTIKKTITFDKPGMAGIAGGNYFPFAYDASSHTLFVGATYVILAIDTIRDVISKVIYLGDMAKAIGLEPWRLVYDNAVAMTYSPQENYLYIAHLDRSFVSIYDLNRGQFLSQVIPVKGHFPHFMFADDDYTRLFTLNMRSDSISVIDVKSKAVEKVIDLHTYE